MSRWNLVGEGFTAPSLSQGLREALLCPGFCSGPATSPGILVRPKRARINFLKRFETFNL